MLKQRVFTALILGPATITAVLLLPSYFIALLFAVMVMLAGREWARLSGLASTQGQLSYMLLLLICMAGGYLLIEHDKLLNAVILISVVWWIAAVFRLSRYHSEKPSDGFVFLRVLEGVIVLLPAWLALVLLHRIAGDGPLLLLFLLMMIWGADVAAYFSGKRWGRTKLAPTISPGKTRAGLYGALFSAILCGIFLAWWRGYEFPYYPLVLGLCLITVLFSVAGDLFESLLKRQQGMKDSGGLLPGHGGMLDRIDSLTAASPVFFLGLLVMGEPV